MKLVLIKGSIVILVQMAQAFLIRKTIFVTKKLETDGQYNSNVQNTVIDNLIPLYEYTAAKSKLRETTFLFHINVFHETLK